MTAQHLSRFCFGPAPNGDLSILAAGDEAAIRPRNQHVHRRVVETQHAIGTTRIHVPNDDRTVEAGGSQAAIGQYGHCTDRAAVTTQGGVRRLRHDRLRQHQPEGNAGEGCHSKQ